MLATVGDYFDMLARDLKQESYSKTEHRRRLMQILHDRSDTAIERKHMNISAVLRGAGLPFIEGYKPLGNYQALLARVVHERISASHALIGRVARVSGELPRTREPWSLADPALEVPRPEPVARENSPAYSTNLPPVDRYDFPKRDAANRELGELGERFILEVEKRRLSCAGRDDLVKEVSWVSKEIGDGAGYDIRSFDPSGTELFVEVKTTNLHRRFPFIVTRNEVKVSELDPNRYRLCRLFHFSRDPHFFVLPGALSETCNLEARSFTAHV